MAYNISCTDPNHAANSAQPGWNDGVLIVASNQITSGIICAGCSAVNTVTANIPTTNLATITNAAINALTANQTFLTNAANVTYPLSTAEQTALVNQVVALTRQTNGLIRVVLQELSSTAGT